MAEHATSRVVTIPNLKSPPQASRFKAGMFVVSHIQRIQQQIVASRQDSF
jgi:hypothetical protein